MTDFFWMDLETSGLDPFHDGILEVGVIHTNERLEMLDQFHRLVEPSPSTLFRIKNTPEVFDMHLMSGLLEELESGLDSETLPNVGQVDEDLSSWLRTLGEPGVHPISGASTHFDRKFAEKCLPRTSSFFHYRNFDISTIKALSKVWKPEIYAKIEAHEKACGKAHRSIPDCTTAIEILRIWLEDYTQTQFVWEASLEEN